MKVLVAEIPRFTGTECHLEVSAELQGRNQTDEKAKINSESLI
jgi:hypothetical protein